MKHLFKGLLLPIVLEMALFAGTPTHRIDARPSDTLTSQTQALASARRHLFHRAYDKAQRDFEHYIKSLPAPERDLFRGITLIAGKDEAARYRQTPPDQQQAFARRLWTRVDPTPLTPTNERLLEHYRRVDYARSRFAAEQFPWDDRGHVYVRLGRPAHISYSWDVQAEETQSVFNARTRFAGRLGAEKIVIPGHPTFPVSTGDHWEYWVYPDIDGGIEFTFVGNFPNGHYAFAPLPDMPAISFATVQRDPLPTFRADTDTRLGNVERPFYSALNHLAGLHGETLLQGLPSDLSTPARATTLPIQFALYPVVFRGQTGQNQLEIFYGLHATQTLHLKPDAVSDQIALNIDAIVYDNTWREIHRLHDRLNLPAPTDQQRLEGAFVPGRMTCQLPAGTYHLAMQVEDVHSGKHALFRKEIAVADYTAQQDLCISDIQLAFDVAPTETPGPFNKNGLRIVPMPFQTFRRNQQAVVYFEVYNLSRDPFGQTAYRIEYALRTHHPGTGFARLIKGIGSLFGRTHKEQAFAISYDQKGNQTAESTHIALDLSQATPGDQQIRVSVTDLLTGQKTSRQTAFSISPH